MITAGVSVFTIYIRKLILSFPCDCKKLLCHFWCFDAVPHDQRKICRCCVMKAIFIFGIQSVRCDKITVLTADLLCFIVHKFCKITRRACNVFCNRHSAVIIRFQHQSVQQIFQIKLLPLPHTQMNFRLWRCKRTHGHFAVQVAVFQCNDTCQYFGRTGIRHRLVPVFFIQDTPGIRIHKHSCFCIQGILIRLFYHFLHPHIFFLIKSLHDLYPISC